MLINTHTYILTESRHHHQQQQTSKQANKQTSNQATKQPTNQPKKQTNKQTNKQTTNNNGRTACSCATDLVCHLWWVRSLASWARSQRPPVKKLSEDADLKCRACGVCKSPVLSAQSSGLVSTEGVSWPANQCDCWLDCSFHFVDGVLRGSSRNA